MNIYDSNGELDLDAARAAGNALPSANVDPKMQAQQITIAALLDIAESLRPLAAEALTALAEDEAQRYMEVDRGDALGTHEFEVGDIVSAEGMGGLGEVLDFRRTESVDWATVRFGTLDATVPLSSLHRLVGDEGEEPDPRAEVIIDKPAEVTLMDGSEPPKDEEGYPILSAAPDLTDELDEDFDGDAHTAAEDAVAKLAEAEAKRKAEKKGKAKK